MKNIFLLFFILIFAGGLFSISCKKKLSCQECLESNKSPIAHAGPDQVITLPADSILLDGSASGDPDGSISEWLWTKISGPSAFNISNSTLAKTVVKNLTVGIYQLELKVTDTGGLFSKDTVQITVNAIPKPTGKIIKARVVEYGTNEPVAGATITICPLPVGFSPCGNSYLRLTTNEKGECFFQANEFSYGGIDHSHDYWNFHWQPCFNIYYGDDSISATKGIHTADSFIVKIVPKTIVTLHVENVIDTNKNNGLERGGLFCPDNAVNFFPGGAIGLYPGIDTTIQYLVFGNAHNTFTVSNSWDDAGNPIHIIYSTILYIPKRHSDTVHIIF